MLRFAPARSFAAACAFATALLGLTLLTAYFLAPIGLLLSPVVLYHSVRPLGAAAARRGWITGYAVVTLALVCLQDVCGTRAAPTTVRAAAG